MEDESILKLRELLLGKPTSKTFQKLWKHLHKKKEKELRELESAYIKEHLKTWSLEEKRLNYENIRKWTEPFLGLVESVAVWDVDSKAKLLKVVGNLTKLSSLKALWLSIFSVRSLRPLQVLQELQHLESLSLFGNILQKDMDFLFPSQELRFLSLDGLSRLRRIDKLSELVGLEELHLLRCPKLETIEPIRELVNLRVLKLSGSLKEKMKKDDCDFPFVEDLSLQDPFDEFEHITRFPNLKRLSVQCGFHESWGNQWWSCEDLSFLRNCHSLEKLELKECYQLRDLTALAELTSLRDLTITGVKHIKNWRSIEKLRESKQEKQRHFSVRNGTLRLTFELGPER